MAVVATHSAYFVREVFRSQVLIIKEQPGRMIEVTRPRLKTFGADVGAISFFVFEHDMTARLFEKLRNELSVLPGQERHIEELKEELSVEALMALKRELNG